MNICKRHLFLFAVCSRELVLDLQTICYRGKGRLDRTKLSFLVCKHTNSPPSLVHPSLCTKTSSRACVLPRSLSLNLTYLNTQQQKGGGKA